MRVLEDTRKKKVEEEVEEEFKLLHEKKLQD